MRFVAQRPTFRPRQASVMPEFDSSSYILSFGALRLLTISRWLAGAVLRTWRFDLDTYDGVIALCRVKLCRYHPIHVLATVQPEARRRLRPQPPPDRRKRLGPRQKRSRVRIVYNCGRSDDPAAAERLRRLASSILRRCAPEELVDRDPSMRVADAWPYGDLYVLEQLWRRVGLPDLIAELAGERKVEFSIERALFAMVANRACAPSSKLYCHEQWLAEDVRIEGCEGLEVHHLYRAMDFLEAHKEELERGLYFGVADLLNLDVELVFYDHLAALRDRR